MVITFRFLIRMHIAFRIRIGIYINIPLSCIVTTYTSNRSFIVYFVGTLDAYSVISMHVSSEWEKSNWQTSEHGSLHCQQPLYYINILNNITLS